MTGTSASSHGSGVTAPAAVDRLAASPLPIANPNAMISLIGKLDVADKKVLVLTDGVKPNVFLSGRNIPNVHVMPYSDSSTYHILWSDVVLVEAGAIGTTLAPITEAAASPKRERPAAAAKVKTAAKKVPAKKAASKTARTATKAKPATAKKSTKKKEK